MTVSTYQDLWAEIEALKEIVLDLERQVAQLKDDLRSPKRLWDAGYGR